MGILDAIRPTLEDGEPTLPVEALTDRKARMIAEAGFRASSKKVGKGGESSIKTEDWQRRSFEAYRTLGEIWYSGQFYSRVLGGLELYAAARQPDGTYKKVETGPGVEAVDRLRDETGSFGTILAPAGRLLFLAGQGYLFGYVPRAKEGQPVDTRERWEFLSSSELKVEGSDEARKYVRIRHRSQAGASTSSDKQESYVEPDAGQGLAPGQGLAYRLWRPDPEYSGDPDSPMRAVLDLCEELGLMTRGIRARLKSRLAAAGIVFLPNEGIPPVPEPPEGEPNDGERSDPFIDKLYEVIVEPIADEAAASGVAPVFIRMGGEHIEKVRMEQWGGSDPARRQRDSEERFETIKRLAIGLDLPPEILLGVTDANHWTAWQIDEDAWKAHVKQIADLIVAELTRAYLIPTLGGAADGGAIVIQYDESEVVTRPDKGDAAQAAHDRMAISDEAYRREQGFDEADAVTNAAEYNRRIGRLLGDPSLATGGAVTEPVADEAPVDDAEGEADGPPADGPGPAEEDGEARGIAASRIMGARDEGAIAACLALAAERARELAGSRLRTRLGRNSHAIPQNVVREAQRVDNRHVAAVLGPEHVASLGLSPDKLVEGGGECFRTFLEGYGLSDIDFHLRHAIKYAEEHLFVRESLAPYRP